MHRIAFPAIGRAIAGLVALALTFGASAQGAQGIPNPQQATDPSALRSDFVKTGLQLITGGGSNTLLRFSAAGLILVDGKLPGNYRALMSQVRKINKLSDLPVRVLIVTDHHPNHAGNNAQFLAAGVPIVAQRNASNRLAPYTPPEGKAAPPVVAYDSEYALRLGGVEVQLRHFGNSVTDGDTVVYFPGLRVVAVGDLYTPGTPEPDYAAGGSLVGWPAVLGRVLMLDFDVAVPSTGPPVTRAEIESFKAKLETLATRAETLVGAGVAKEQLLGRLRTDDLGWRLRLDDAQLAAFYAEASRPR